MRVLECWQYHLLVVTGRQGTSYWDLPEAVKPFVFVPIFLFFLEEQEECGVRQVDQGWGLVFVICEMEAVCRQTRRVREFSVL